MRDLIEEGRALMRHWYAVVKPINDALTADYRRRHQAATRRVSLRCLQRWKRENPERYRALRRRIDTVKRQGRCGIPRGLVRMADAIKRQLLSAYGLPCAYCNTVMGKTETVDHIFPLSLGGKHEPWNLAPCCRACNSSKGKKLLA